MSESTINQLAVGEPTAPQPAPQSAIPAASSRHLRVLLFDIDGTLLLPAHKGVYREQVRTALMEVFGCAGQVDQISFSGKTDLQIMREALSCEGITPAQIREALPMVAERFVAILPQLAVSGPAFNCCVGVNELLLALKTQSRYQLSILTGNVEPLATAKLTEVGLHHYFSLRGAFGSDDEDRRLLPAIAAARINQQLGITLSPAQFIIIGDTPRDIECARHFGARVIAVATGGSTTAELTTAAPDLVLPDLRDTNAVLAALLEL